MGIGAENAVDTPFRRNLGSMIGVDGCQICNKTTQSDSNPE